MRRFLLASLILLIPTISLFAQGTMELLHLMLAECAKIQSIQFVMKKQERQGNTMHEDMSLFKISKYPFRMYMKQIAPRPGLEALYVEGKNDGDVLINPNGFPYVNVSLNPLGKRLRENQHHTVFELGYDYICSILRYLLKKYGEEKFSQILKSEGTIKFNNQECYKLIAHFDDFTYFAYEVKNNENISDIAKRFYVSDHMIKEKNGLSSYDCPGNGTKLLVPSVYAKEIKLYISKSLKVPLYINCSDDKGVYEIYEFSNVLINPAFKPNEFSEDNPDYGF